jgi:hypothetical protein
VGTVRHAAEHHNYFGERSVEESPEYGLVVDAENSMPLYRLTTFTAFPISQ